MRHQHQLALERGREQVIEEGTKKNIKAKEKSGYEH